MPLQFFNVLENIMNNRRGDRTHVGHCSKLDSVLKYSKNGFKILDFTRIVLDVMMLDPV
jgi:hypothetical protein